jgi:hypothetical protein
LKGTGFNPYIIPAKSRRALAPKGMLAFPENLFRAFLFLPLWIGDSEGAGAFRPLKRGPRIEAFTGCGKTPVRHCFVTGHDFSRAATATKLRCGL